MFILFLAIVLLSCTVSADACVAPPRADISFTWEYYIAVSNIGKYMMPRYYVTWWQANKMCKHWVGTLAVANTWEEHEHGFRSLFQGAYFPTGHTPEIFAVWVGLWRKNNKSEWRAVWNGSKKDVYMFWWDDESTNKTRADRRRRSDDSSNVNNSKNQWVFNFTDNEERNQTIQNTEGDEEEKEEEKDEEEISERYAALGVRKGNESTDAEGPDAEGPDAEADAQGQENCAYYLLYMHPPMRSGLVTSRCSERRYAMCEYEPELTGKSAAPAPAAPRPPSAALAFALLVSLADRQSLR